jgi:aryl-alcohol dehydrogenase-like predicted oxidoreductase
MHVRRFGNDGTLVSEVGLGCWQLGGSDWGAISEEDALATLRASAESGVNILDTADVYGLGRSETLVGKFLKEWREPVFVATKLGRFPDPGGAGNITREAVRRHTEASLRRLGVDCLDLTQLHCIPTEAMRQGEVFQWMRELQDEGKIGRFGASVESMEEALICMEQPDLASLQIIFNIFRQKPIATIFERAKAQGVGLIVRLPLASGLLAGKFTAETQFEPNDHRNYNRDGQAFNVGETFAGLPFQTGVALADALKPMVPEGLTMTQMALRWCLDFDAVTTIIPGAKSPQMARDNAAVTELTPLPAELHAALADFYEASVAAHIRGPY